MAYRPSEQMRKNAKKALEFRKTLAPSQRYGTPVGLARARDIARGVRLSRDTIVRMRSFLARHRGNAEKQRKAGEYGKARGAYDLWGGFAAIGWVNDKIRKYRRAGEL
tara:strand:- start:431 stop:754 length:324 start_codon:yes stop_codon:yes gene_type:complete